MAIDDSASINVIIRLMVPLSLTSIDTFLHWIVHMLCIDGLPWSLYWLTNHICSVCQSFNTRLSSSEVILPTIKLASRSCVSQHSSQRAHKDLMAAVWVQTDKPLMRYENKFWTKDSYALLQKGNHVHLLREILFQIIFVKAL